MKCTKIVYEEDYLWPHGVHWCPWNNKTIRVKKCVRGTQKILRDTFWRKNCPRFWRKRVKIKPNVFESNPNRRSFWTLTSWVTPLNTDFRDPVMNGSEETWGAILYCGLPHPQFPLLHVALTVTIDFLPFQFNLVCDKGILVETVQSVFFGGILAGAVISGLLSDIVGRKLIIHVSLVGAAIFGLALSLVWNYYVVVVLMFFVGVFQQVT